MKKVSVLILILELLLCGCTYANDADSQSFVIAVGIDKGGQMPLCVSFIFANPSGEAENSDSQKSTGEESGSSSSLSPDTVTVEAATVFSAVKKLDAIKSKKINLTHTKLVVFSDEIARSGIKKYVKGFASSHDFRPNTYVCISSGNAKSYLESVKPAHEKYTEKYYDHIMQKVAVGKLNESYLYNLYFNLNKISSSSVVPLVGVNKNSLTPPVNARGNFTDDFSYEARAGEILREASNKAEILGAAVFSGDKLVTTLGSFQTDITRLIRNEYYPKNYSILYKTGSDFVTFRLTQQTKPQIKSAIKNGEAHIDILVPLSIEYIDAPFSDGSPENSDEFIKALSKRLQNAATELTDEFRQEYNCDFIGIGESLRKHFLTLSSWERFVVENGFKRYKINISFDILSADFEEIN